MTWCKNPDYLYGNLLSFKTLRDGFPNARIHVVDNASNPVCRIQIKDAAYAVDAQFSQIEHEIPHYQFIERVVETQNHGSTIFVDPDMCFWGCLEDWEFDALAAGRHIPKFYCEYTKCITHPRLHTSLLWIPDVAVLRNTINSIKESYFDFSPFRPIMVNIDQAWHRFDTTACLYAGLEKQLYRFTDQQLDLYDHLFCGTHVNNVSPSINEEYARIFTEMHFKVKNNHLALKGAWRLQEEYFNNLAVHN
jgi:hypothetical protein